MVHAGLYRFSQNSNRGVNVARRSEHLRASELHCAVAHAIHVQRCARQSEAPGEACLLQHFVPPDPFHYYFL
jgi:hypothetical protein